MFCRPVLIAETDPQALNILPRILSDRIPGLAIESCSSTEELSQKSELS